MIEAMTQTGEPIPGATPEITTPAKPPISDGSVVPKPDAKFLTRLAQKVPPNQPGTGLLAIASADLKGPLDNGFVAGPPIIEPHAPMPTVPIEAVPPQSQPAEGDGAMHEVAPPAPQPKIEDRGLTPEEVRSLGTRAERFIDQHDGEVINGTESPYDPYMLTDARRTIKPEIGKRFDTHRISQGTIRDIESLNDLLTNGIVPGKTLHTLPLRLTDKDEIDASGLGAQGPLSTGSFLVIGKPDQMIRDGGIGGVIVHEAYYDAIPTLQERFPDVKFIKASEVTEGINALIAEKEAATDTDAPKTKPEVDSATAEPTTGNEGQIPGAGPLSYEANVLKEWQDAVNRKGEKLSPQEEARFIELRQEAAEKDRALFASSLVRAEAEEMLGGRLGHLANRIRTLFRRESVTDKDVNEARNAHDKSYKELFENMRHEDKKSFISRLKSKFNGEDLNRLKKMTDDAQTTKDNLKAIYETAKEGGTPEEISEAKRNYDAARLHHSAINKEKRKKAIWAAIRKALLFLGLSTVMESGKTVKNSTSEAVSQPRI